MQHCLEQYETVRWIVSALFIKDLTDEQLRHQPKEGLNSIAWYMWHTARWQDFANTLISPGRGQVLNKDWLVRLNVTRRDVGTGMRVLTIPRSKNGEMRHIPLNSDAISALEAFRKRGGGTGKVIRDLDGEPLAGSRYWFEPALKKAKIYRFSWHCLRHTFASRLVMRGVDIRTVQELMGHKSISMTVRYSHLAPKHTLAAVELLAGSHTAAPTDTKTSTGANEQEHVEVAITQ